VRVDDDWRRTVLATRFRGLDRGRSARSGSGIGIRRRDLSRKPSRLDNLLEIEVMRRPDGCTHQTVQAIVDRGVRMLSLKTKYPVPGPIQADARAYMEFVFEQGNVVDQWTGMSRRSEGAERSK
jgi:hypothetical protein